MDTQPAGIGSRPQRLVALVSVYDSERFLHNRIDNLLNQTLEGLEICVYDAASPGREGDVVRSFLGDPRLGRHALTYYRSGRRDGLYAAWNWIIRHSRSEYLATANADDVIHPDYFRRAAELLEAGHDLVYCDWYVTDRENQSWPPDHYSDVVRTPVGTTCGHFPVWRRSLHERYGPFDERFQVLGDSEWWKRLRKHRAREAKLGEPLGLYTSRGEHSLYWTARDDAGQPCYRSEERLLKALGY